VRLVSLIFWLIFWCAIAAADIESPLVKSGLAAYDAHDPARAVDLLTRALGESLTREEKTAALSTLGSALDALGQHEAARQRFAELGRLAPGVEASPPTFDPGRPREGDAVRVTLDHPGGLAARAQIFFRTRGESGFSQLEVRGNGHFSTVIPDAHAPALEVHALILDERGLPLAHAASPASPLSLEVLARKKPIYKRGWFWGVLGGAAAAVVIVGLAAGLSTEKPVHLVVQPQ
jgi:hypothetical protein